ncbi:leucine-rich repeat extensin-like protein 3 [Iris pallida]|uniref:Leucine-rich repeat extensin-like protein 3 n=1 Tax=Iris pallida TaxID=29817 RepID=A0AAX6FH10_IRIPA|nr:leucine-rich repeat extensin-like protein 3 [Iris pallida]
MMVAVNGKEWQCCGAGRERRLWLAVGRGWPRWRCGGVKGQRLRIWLMAMVRAVGLGFGLVLSDWIVYRHVESCPTEKGQYCICKIVDGKRGHGHGQDAHFCEEFVDAKI